MDRSLLSVIIPAYNTANYLEQTLNILSNQCYKNIEIIVINDNSTDNTDKVIEKHLSTHSNLLYLKNEVHCGAGLSRNRGLECAHGEFLTFLDSDDWVDMGCYKTAINRMQQESTCDIAIWGIKNEFNNSQSSYTRTNYKDYNEIDKNMALSLLCNSFAIDTKISSYLGSKIFRSSLIYNNNITFGDYLFEDIEFTCRAINKSNRIFLLPEIFTHYRQREQSIIHTFSEEHIDSTFVVLKKIRPIFYDNFNNNETDYKALVEKSCKNIINFLFANIYDSNEQRKYIKLFFNRLLKFTSLNNIIDYLDISRIKKIFLEI